MIGPIIHYQDNGNEAFWGRLITGNDHNGHDHIHYKGSLQHRRALMAGRGHVRGLV